MSLNCVKANEFLKKSDKEIARMTVISKKLAKPSIYESIRQSLKYSAKGVSRDGKLSSVKVHFFGSRVIGLATDESDLDIFVEIDNSFYSSYSKSWQSENRLHFLADAVELNQDWRVTNRIPKASVPIIVAVFKPMNLDCDINITNGTANVECELLAHLFKLQPEAVSLFHFIRKWMKVQNFDLFKGYTITLLLVFYLQSKNLMPTVKVVQRGVRQRYIEGLPVEFDESRSLRDYEVNEMNNYKKHISGFFKFFADFNYFQVISPYDGKAHKVEEYKYLHPKFLLKGIFLAGPIRIGKNCGIADQGHQEEFADFCKASSKFLIQNKINY